MTLRVKLLLLYLVLLVSVTGLLVWRSSVWLDEFRREAARQRLEDSVRALAPFFDPLDPDVDQKVDASSRGVSFRITVVDWQGRVRGDSSFSGEGLNKLENHGNRPEIQQARTEGLGSCQRYSTSVDQRLVYVALALPQQRGFLRLALSVDGGGALASLASSLAVPFAALAFAGFLLTSWIAGRWARSVQALAETVEQIGAGDFPVGFPSAGARREEFGRLERSLDAMARRLQRRLAEASQGRPPLDSVLDGMSEGLMVTDSRGRIRDVNAAFLRIFQIAADPAGKMPLEVIRSSELMSALRRSLQENRPHEIELHFNEKVLRARLAPVSVDREGPGMAAIFHDVTELRRLERVRKDFIANVSHELKTPLTSIRGYAETLEDDQRLDSASREFARKVRRNAEQLQEIVEALLEMSRLEGEVQRVPRQEVQVEALLRGLEKNFANRLAQKGLRLTLSNPQRVEAFRAGEPYLQRVLFNLVDNALKYTESGEIRIGIERQPGKLLFSVADTGVGIPEADQARVFERFYRTAAARSLAPGSGIGLSIVHHVVQLLGGEVWLTSKPGQGTTVYFTLPQ